MRKYVRVEKTSNGYLLQVGGPGTSEKQEKWIAASLQDVTELLASILGVVGGETKP